MNAGVVAIWKRESHALRLCSACLAEALEERFATSAPDAVDGSRDRHRNVRCWLLSDILTGVLERPLYPRKQTSKGVAVTMPVSDSPTRLPSLDG